MSIIFFDLPIVLRLKIQATASFWSRASSHHLIMHHPAPCLLPVPFLRLFPLTLFCHQTLPVPSPSCPWLLGLYYFRYFTLIYPRYVPPLLSSINLYRALSLVSLISICVLPLPVCPVSFYSRSVPQSLPFTCASLRSLIPSVTSLLSFINMTLLYPGLSRPHSLINKG